MFGNKKLNAIFASSNELIANQHKDDTGFNGELGMLIRKQQQK